jgi:hypothetical protein
MKYAAGLIFLILFSTTAIATNQPPKQIAAFKKWHVYSMQQKGKKVNYVVGTPIKSEGKYKVRGTTCVMITNRPPRATNIISIHAGYEYPTNLKVKVTIDSKTFIFIPHSDTPGTAWLTDDNDAEVIRAMVNGSKMTVQSESKRGTKTTDIYALRGIASAVKAIKKR